MDFNILWGRETLQSFCENSVLCGIYQAENLWGKNFLSSSIISQIFFPIFFVREESIVEEYF